MSSERVGENSCAAESQSLSAAALKNTDNALLISVPQNDETKNNFYR